jgi:hypothetical protein
MVVVGLALSWAAVAAGAPFWFAVLKRLGRVASCDGRGGDDVSPLPDLRVRLRLAIRDAASRAMGVGGDVVWEVEQLC